MTFHDSLLTPSMGMMRKDAMQMQNTDAKCVVMVYFPHRF